MLQNYKLSFKLVVANCKQLDTFSETLFLSQIALNRKFLQTLETYDNK